MKQIKFNIDLIFGQEAFSFSRTRNPKSGEKIWAVNYGLENSDAAMHIPYEVLEHCQEICENRWTGWGFAYQPGADLELPGSLPLLLFTDPSDAVMAELLYST